jgi:hypothetical protein
MSRATPPRHAVRLDAALAVGPRSQPERAPALVAHRLAGAEQAVQGLIDGGVGRYGGAPVGGEEGRRDRFGHSRPQPFTFFATKINSPGYFDP